MTALNEHANVVKALGATSLYLFGSTARDEAGPASDLDLFVEYDRNSRFSLIELVGIKLLCGMWCRIICRRPRLPSRRLMQR